MAKYCLLVFCLICVLARVQIASVNRVGGKKETLRYIFRYILTSDISEYISEL